MFDLAVTPAGHACAQSLLIVEEIAPIRALVIVDLALPKLKEQAVD